MPPPPYSTARGYRRINVGVTMRVAMNEWYNAVQYFALTVSRRRRRLRSIQSGRHRHDDSLGVTLRGMRMGRSGSMVVCEIPLTRWRSPDHQHHPQPHHPAATGRRSPGCNGKPRASSTVLSVRSSLSQISTRKRKAGQEMPSRSRSWRAERKGSWREPLPTSTRQAILACSSRPCGGSNGTWAFQP